MNFFLSELLATMTLVFLGDGVCANVSLNKSGMKGAGAIQITIAWGLAVTIAAFMYGNTSGGACMNPAIVIANIVMGSLTFFNGLWMILGEMVGAFVGAFFVHMFWKQQFDATEDAATKLGVFSTAPSVKNTLNNFFCEFAGTALLFWFGNAAGAWGPDASALAVIPTFCIIMAIGMSLGGATGYAINPARDAGPRLYHTVAFKGDDHNWGYGWKVVVADIAGAVFAALLFMALKGVAL